MGSIANKISCLKSGRYNKDTQTAWVDTASTIGALTNNLICILFSDIFCGVYLGDDNMNELHT